MVLAWNYWNREHALCIVAPLAYHQGPLIPNLYLGERERDPNQRVP